jgi:hypothetical protein
MSMLLACIHMHAELTMSMILVHLLFICAQSFEHVCRLGVRVEAES